MKPEAGQWWVDSEAVPGDSADDVAVRIAIVLPDKKLYVETSRGVYDVWTHVNENVWHHEPRCTGWDWVMPEPQPAEAPDEWVIQDRVPVRVGDRCYWVGSEPLPKCWSKMWQAHPHALVVSRKNRHGDKTDDGKETLHVMCRRRDLPKIEQKANDGTDWSYHNQQKPQPRKTMLRLWIDSDCNIHAGLKGDSDLELHYDHETRQFYTENQS